MPVAEWPQMTGSTPHSTPPALIFTDLDGTLLDHDSYRWDAARPMLDRLRRAGIPVVLASSKTAAEMIPLRAAMALGPVPMICENGAGLVGADNRAAAQPGPHARLRATLARIAPGLRADFEGFSDMAPARLAELTGLPPEAAALAARRQFSEPGVWHGDAESRARFVRALAAAGIAARQGGRFLTLSFGGTKADRMAEISDRYGNPPTVALGDAPNDAEMLQAADHAILIANPAAPPMPPLRPRGRLRRSTAPGPAGWAQELAALLAELDIATKEPDLG